MRKNEICLALIAMLFALTLMSRAFAFFADIGGPPTARSRQGKSSA